MKKIGIVIVNYNGAKYQNDCLESLYSMTNTDFDIIVIDNNSSDNSLELLEKQYKDVIILRQEENVGVAAGNNIGIEYCKKYGYEYILLMNNDVEVDKKLLEKMLEDTPKYDVIVPKIYYYNPHNMIWYGGGNLDWKRASACHWGIDKIDNGEYDRPQIISYSPTCCMLLHNSVFDKVGLMDEELFMYYDDTDFCVRLLENDISIRYQPNAVMWHKVSSSTGGNKSKLNVYYMNRNQLYYIKKHKKYIPKYAIFFTYLKGVIKFVLSPIRCKNEKYILSAYYDFLRGKMGRKN